MPSKIPEGENRGWIVPIGGAENKENDRHILERFIRVSGGANADIVVIPTASRMHETGPRYEAIFKELGASEVTVMDFDTRRDCQEAGRLRRIEAATGIFFTGGNQLRLTTLLGGTPVAKLIRVRNAHGVTVGGTSAGASILSEHMIAFGDEGSSVISGSVRLAPGLGKIYVKAEFLQDLCVVFAKIWKVLDETQLSVLDLDNKLVWKKVMKECEVTIDDLPHFKSNPDLLFDFIQKVCQLIGKTFEVKK